MAAKIKKGDKVMVMTGKDKGKVGEVMRIVMKDNRAFVQGVNVAKRHTRPSQSIRGVLSTKNYRFICLTLHTWIQRKISQHALVSERWKTDAKFVSPRFRAK